jgi:hypothetical protein
MGYNQEVGIAVKPQAAYQIDYAVRYRQSSLKCEANECFPQRDATMGVMSNSAALTIRRRFCHHRCRPPLRQEQALPTFVELSFPEGPLQCIISLLEG